MSVHYKFKSALDFDTITFDGLHISVADLKKAIIHQKRLGKTMDFDLQITNAQTKEEYGDDSVLIPKNTSLTIARVPLKNAPKKNWEPKRSRDQDQDNQSGQGTGSGAATAASRKGQDAAMQSNVDLSTMNGTEEDKIREMMFQSTAEYDPTNYQRIRGQSQTGEVPINYKCYRCHKPGHWIKNCPLGPLPKEAMEVVKRTSGIPRSFIERDKDPENNPIIQLPQVVPEEKQVIPEDLICAICKDLFTDAVMIPCCGSSFCDECVRTALLESEDNECPDCKEKGSSPGSLIPNRFLRNSVNAFRNETGYTKAPPKVNNKQTKPVEEPAVAEQTAVSSSTNVIETSRGEADAEEQHSKEHPEEGQQESADHCDLHESYEEVSQHGDIGSPNGDDKAFDNDSDYEDGITVTVPPAHVQSRGASRLHYNGRSSHYPRHETPPTGSYEYPREPYNSGTSSSGGSRSERPEVNHKEGSGESRPPKPEDKDSNYNTAPSGAPKHEYGSRSPDYHQPSRGLIPLPTRGHPQQHPPMGGMPPHSGYMGAPHQGPPGPGYPGAPHPGPHPYPGGYGMQPGYPPQRPYDHPGGMYHGERPPRMMYPPRGGYAPHPPHMRPRHMAPMGPGGYPGVPHVGTGVIDDPLEAFNRIMREKERRKEQEAAKQASRHRSSPHGERSRRSRSFENDGGGGGGGGGKRSSRRSTDRERRRSPRARSPDRRRSPEEKHGGEREGGGRRRRNRSSSYSSGSRSYSRSPAKRGKSPKRRSSRSPQYRERRTRSRSKSFDERRHSKHSKDRSRDERRDDHRGDYRDNRDRSPGYGSHYSGYRGRGGGYRGGMRGRGGSRGDGGYYRGYGGERGHMPPQDQYGHPMGGPVDYHHHDPSVVIPQHHHGVPPMSAGPGGHYVAAPQQAMATGGPGGGVGGPVPSRFPPRDGRDPYMGHGPVKTDPMGYGYEDSSRQVPMQPQPVPQQQQQQPAPSVEPPPPGFEEQDNWSGKQESEYRAPANVTAVKPVDESAGYEYHNTPKSRDHERAHTPVIRDEMEGAESSSKKKSRDGGDGDHHRSREERRGRSKTPDRHDKDKSKRGDRDDRDKKRGDVSKDKRVGEKERHRESEKDREAKRKQRDSSEEEKKDKKKDKEKKKRKKEKEAEKKKHKKERKEKDKDKRSKEGKKERKTVEKEEADSSLQPATPKHAPRREEGDQEKEQQQVDTTQEYMADLDDTLVIPERCHDLSKTASEAEDNSYREEPSSSHDQQEEQHQQDQIDLGHEHSDLYSDIPEKYEGDQLEKSVLEGHIGEEEDTDLVNSSGVAAEDHDEIKRSDSILDLHANLDFEGELEEGEHQSPPKFISIPELSKWELDEDTPLISSSDRKADDHNGSATKHEDTSNKVTNEVLKRAENAIFTRAINAIRPIEIKKISVDRQKLYSNETHEHDADVVEIKSEKHDKQQDELKRFQVTVPTNDDHAERSVEIKHVDVGKDGRASPVRGSIKERLGSKITEVRSGGSRSGTFSRSRTPPQSGLRKVKSSTSATKLVDSSSSSRKRSRSKSASDRDGTSRSRPRGDERGRRGEEIKISSSSSGGSRRVDIGRRLVVQVREVTPDKRRGEGERKERRSRERVLKEATSSGGDRSRDRVVRRSRERSREKRMEREREREKERKRGGEGKDRGDTRRKSPEKSSHGYKDDKKSLERKSRAEGESERRRRERSSSPVRRSKDEDPGQRFVEALGRVVQEVVPTKKSKSDKSIAKSKPASSSDSSSSDSESSSSDSSSDSDDESARKRKKRKHKKDRKRAKRSASTESDDSGSKKKKKSKKSKSGKKKKKEKKHRKGE